MQDLMSEKIDLVALALSKAQSEIENINKDKQGYGYKYADLSNCLQAIKKPLRDNGLSISQLGICTTDDKKMLVTLLMHESGQWLKSTFPIEIVELKQCNSLQNLGAGLTYLRRYALSALIGLTQEDDDAQSLNKTNAPSKVNKQEFDTDYQLVNSDLKVLDKLRIFIEEDKISEAIKLCESHIKNRKQRDAIWYALSKDHREKLMRGTANNNKEEKKNYVK